MNPVRNLQKRGVTKNYMYNKISNGVNKFLIAFLLFGIIILPACGKKDNEQQSQSENQVITDEKDNDEYIPENDPTPPLVNIVNSDKEALEVDLPLDPEFSEEKAPQVIDGETDSYGCLIAAGYTWCENKQTCILDWEEDCNPGRQAPDPGEDLDRAIQIAQDYFEQSDEYKDGGNNLTTMSTSQNECIGCWDIEFQYEKNIENEMELISTTVTLENWQVKN